MLNPAATTQVASVSPGAGGAGDGLQSERDFQAALAQGTPPGQVEQHDAQPAPDGSRGITTIVVDRLDAISKHLRVDATVGAQEVQPSSALAAGDPRAAPPSDGAAPGRDAAPPDFKQLFAEIKVTAASTLKAQLCATVADDASKTFNGLAKGS